MSLELRHIRKSYNGRSVLNIDSLKFEDGKIYAVIGSNGAGKTTLLRIIAGLENPDSGECCFDDGRVFQPGMAAFLSQKPYIFDITVFENVKLGLSKECRCNEIAYEALELIGMQAFINARATSLSGGEVQRVTVARTLVLGRKLVLLDEPASSVDIASINLVENYIRRVNKKDGSTIIFTTHNPSQAARLADEAIFIQNGEILEKAYSNTLINFPEEKETVEFLKYWRA